ncbi:MAG: bifunctional proline dehydrogenase/L-glutamate gamma-semialdehyde dehydrogenase PutA [Methylobacteriaceae bacterium]|nr:bifunctional proline dehydrogenase/L-glutamate gamma-semialdehyde dehydrogenase PutA [Methylobacteriaceae bacterium]MBV9246896.1 bifunctional proline dehydrogenase/L-glutamate gamma-semialdehyde dehydrogenase PutA [Methylobacteriaceae bacterium]
MSLADPVAPPAEQVPAFVAPYAPPDDAIAAELLASAWLPRGNEARIDARARQLIEAIRSRSGGFGGIEDVLHEYSLSTKEGLALMVLAEALLRVPDAATADQLIEDKLAAADWAHHATKSDTLLVTASAWALGISARIIQPGETPEGVLAALAKRLGTPAVRGATRRAMRLMGSHFVLGQTIEEALSRAASGTGRLYRYSFDMLGEGSRTAVDAERYFASYANAINAIGRAAGNAPLPGRPGISVKLSALHPRYEAISRERVLRELVPRVVDLARRAKGFDLNFTVDAEEADRLELSLDVIAAAVADRSLAGWEGFGLAIQAYQKRARGVIDFVLDLAERHDRRFMVRLVKGAYWDTEVKRAQERGLDDYPVFTRKAMTDLHYMACVEKLLAARARLYPQFATHNALTVAAILERAHLHGDGAADGREDLGFEFQRLHGMGEDLYRALLADCPGAACRTYAPVGGHQDLLAYLVRRLLENGANSSFVSVAADPNVPIADLLVRPQAIVGSPERARHPRLPLPADIYMPARKNSAGLEFGDRRTLADMRAATEAAGLPTHSIRPIIDGKSIALPEREARSPIDGNPIGRIAESTPAVAAAAMEAARRGLRNWSETPAAHRAAIVERMADLMESQRPRLFAILQAEGGKTLDDAVAEVREAIDFCRYYAAEARRTFAAGETLPGPTGESNQLTYRGRGVFVCISPWNFPLAIFLGQIAAALLAGNAVVAKPAEQTPIIGHEAIRLLHAAGVPAAALAFVPGDGSIGAALVEHRHTAGVAFTGSTETAWRINRTLAAKDGPIVPLIAETGGINAMIVDATALPEQVADDAVTSAFRSTGQRCSALRLLCVQDDVADKIIEMVAGAARELRIGDPREVATHIGPVIDAEAKQRLETHIAAMRRSARTVEAGLVPPNAPGGGFYVAPHIFVMRRVADLEAEVFGPILHVVRYPARELDRVLDAIEATGFGLTLGVHSRIDATIERVIARLDVGNCYVNRNMIGAVVGTQPFGGSGLSGTGPKAGGPNYLKRFAVEQVVSINTAAAGGNASLIAMGE